MNRIPESAANEQPSAHANIDARSGCAPFNDASGRSSTAARIATPARTL
jgi:hypothetical protein